MSSIALPAGARHRGRARLRRRALLVRARAAPSRAPTSSGSRSASRSSTRSTRRRPRQGLSNLRAVFCNINIDLPTLVPDASLARVYVNFPDPVVQAAPSEAAPDERRAGDDDPSQAARRRRAVLPERRVRPGARRDGGARGRDRPLRQCRSGRGASCATTSTAPGRCARCAARIAACASGACATVGSVRRAILIVACVARASAAARQRTIRRSMRSCPRTRTAARRHGASAATRRPSRRCASASGTPAPKRAIRR